MHRIRIVIFALSMFTLNPMGLSNESSFSKKTYVYKTIGGCAIKADVYRVPGNVVRPVLLWIHGGALIFGHRGTIHFDQLNQYLKAGFVVVSIDYRLAPETKLPEILDDVQDAYGWIRAKGPELFRINPDRIAVVGHSAGGYLALVSGYRFRPRPRAIVSFYGYGDIIGEWYSRPAPFFSREPAISKENAYQAVGTMPLSEALNEDLRSPFYLYCRQNGLWPKEVTGRDPNTEPKAFDPFCPVRNVSKDFPPTLLLHGDKDTDVPFEQSQQMARELKRSGIKHELVLLPDRGHGFDSDLDDPRVARAFECVITFLKDHLQ